MPRSRAKQRLKKLPTIISEGVKVTIVPPPPLVFKLQGPGLPNRNTSPAELKEWDAKVKRLVQKALRKAMDNNGGGGGGGGAGNPWWNCATGSETYSYPSGTDDSQCDPLCC
jgi:hypothetical protein